MPCRRSRLWPMDIRLDQSIDIREKTQDDLDDENQVDLLNEAVGGESLTGDEEQTSIPDGSSTSRPRSGMHYQFRNADNGQVTYRVVQVGGDENNQQATLSIVTTNGILNTLSQEDGNSGGQQVAIVGNPFSGDSGNEGSSNTASGSSAPRFAYFQSNSGNSDLPSPTATGSSNSNQTDQQMLAGGQFYVMMSPQDMLQSGTSQSGRTIINRSQFSQRDDGTKTSRDDTRRVQHNEVERRRRDKINTWILKLAGMIPDCANDHTKQGQSKGGILAKACDHIVDLQNANAQLSEKLVEMDQIQINYELCRQQLDEAKRKIEILTQTLQSNGIEVTLKMMSSP